MGTQRIAVVTEGMSGLGKALCARLVAEGCGVVAIHAPQDVEASVGLRDAGVAPYAADLKTIAPYSAQLKTIAPYSTELTAIAPYSAQLTALSKVPPSAIAYLTAHGAAVQQASVQTASQWKTWYWVCFGGLIFFLLSIPLLRGRWRPSAARRDAAEHEAMVQAELAKLSH